MKPVRILVVLTSINVAAVAVNLRPARLAAQPEVLPMVRTRALQIVDDQGRVRASIEIQPASAAAGSAPRSNETVLLRLITERGRPSVKIGASESSAGLSFSGPTGTSDTYVVLKSEGTASLLKLRNEDGREQVIKP